VVDGTQLPRVAPDFPLRHELESFADRHGPNALFQRLVQLDPAAAQRIDPRNLRRVVRAIEVTVKTGRPFSDGSVGKPRHEVLTIGVTAERTALYEKIDRRVDDQVARGLVEETRRAIARAGSSDRPAFQGFGYREMVKYLAGNYDFDTAVERHKFESHRFVRQQYTWFRLTDPQIHWLETGRVDLVEQCFDVIRGFVARRAGEVQEVCA
jgi:tRNA dimethylallyltransferase